MTTASNYLYQSLVESFDRLGVDWEHAMSLVTGGAPQMIGRNVGGAKRLKNLCNFHCIVHQESLCSQIMKVGNVKNVVVKTVNFIRKKGLNYRQFNRKTQGYKLVIDLYERICAFESKLELLEKQLSENNPFIFQF
ncbi:General transcription factor II-I repeat domain-containing protein 2A [Thelohanellus kitauei]|uniref:General transcription factor II-I repeat domain-containing protein 2A n=1 Tax=Thelohanellus kitauei TaxID=669202 RepID=A0A0C2MUM6_THEKT|nr:General transcription factor II-I repeat domain-containing protein 2A [Thelohanellus kitauei]